MDSPPLIPVPERTPTPPASTVYPLGERLTQGSLALLVASFVVLLGFRGYDLRFRTRPTESVASPSSKLDLNSAARGELELLPGVGPRLANAIDDHRKNRGPFRSVEDLRAVQGIGKTTLEKLTPFLTVAPRPPAPESVVSEEPLVLTRKPPPTPAAPPVATTAPSTAGIVKVTATESKVNINTATAEELMRLPAIGTKLAQAIIEYRKTTPFQRIEDLGKVRGIGLGKTFEKVRPFIAVE